MTSQKEIFRELFKDGIDPNKIYKSGNNIYSHKFVNVDKIHKLVLCEEISGLKHHLKKNPDDVNLLCNYGTPLHLCAIFNIDINITNMLIDAGADINAYRKHNMTPLHVAAQENNLELVKLLVYNGAKVNAKDIDGYTPICEAAMNYHTDVVRFLFNISDLSLLVSDREENVIGIIADCVPDLIVELINEKNSENTKLKAKNEELKNIIQTYEDYGPPLAPDGGKGFQESKEHFKSF